jgi:outer membrane PBP1 activator LpoA protein
MKIHLSLHSCLLITSLLLALLLSACEPLRDVKPVPGDVAALSLQVQNLEQQGQYREAAELILNQAGQIQEPARTDLLIRATHLLINAGNIERAVSVLQRIPVESADPLLQTRRQLLQAQILIHEEQPEKALALLTVNDALPVALRALTHELRARAYLLSGNNLESARERIVLESLLLDATKIDLNREQIWESLRQLSPVFLQQMTMEPAPDILSGWLSLVMISKTLTDSTDAFEASIAQWKASYPLHPASGRIMEKLIAHYRAIKKPEKLALILPSDGKLSKAAGAIRDGFLAAYYQQQGMQARTEIRVYDSSANNQSIQAIYQQAVADGAEFIIGPLDKEKVTELASMTEFPVPVLTLNQTDNYPVTANNLFQFGLNPEDEARQIAERASLEGMVHAITITPQGDWGKRMATAFSERFQQLGGIILQHAQYDFRSNDFSLPIKRVLNIDESEQRYNRLRNALPTEIKFVPRRRRDVDFIFMAAFPKQARQIVPQLRFHHAADIPVYTTSNAYSGQQSKQQNKDMGGVVICDSDWILSPPGKSDPLYTQLNTLWPRQMDRYARLFALGIDAYRILGQLRWLQGHPSERFEGVTGRLSLGDYNRIHRTLKWGRFEGGEIKAVNDIQPRNLPLSSTP